MENIFLIKKIENRTGMHILHTFQQHHGLHILLSTISFLKQSTWFHRFDVDKILLCILFDSRYESIMHLRVEGNDADLHTIAVTSCLAKGRREQH